MFVVFDFLAKAQSVQFQENFAFLGHDSDFLRCHDFNVSLKNSLKNLTLEPKLITILGQIVALGGDRMKTLTQKKFSISIDQGRFLADYKKWGFSNQSSIVRKALDRLIRDIRRERRRELMKIKADELLPDYEEDKELSTFTILDGEDLL